MALHGVAGACGGLPCASSMRVIPKLQTSALRPYPSSWAFPLPSTLNEGVVATTCVARA